MSKELTNIKSISTKNIGFSAKTIRALVEDNNEVHFLARIGGVAIEQFTGTTKHGEYHGYKGVFSIVNRDGVKFTSTVLFPPANIAKKLADMFSQGEAEISFMFDINVSSSDKNASGYAFMVDVPASEEALKKAAKISETVFGSRLPQLASPSKPAKKSA